MEKVIVYGADWCPQTNRTLDHLRKLGAPHDYIDVEKDEHASQWVKGQNNGREIKPTVDVAGNILSEPTNAELDKALQALQSAYTTDAPPG
jgi:glutaredoxin